MTDVTMGEVVVARVPPDDPRVVPVIETHVAQMDDGTTPREACHRLDLSGLLEPSITFFGAFAGDPADPAAEVVGIGAFADRTDDPAAAEPWGEVKSMHVLAAHRGRGIAQQVLDAIETAAAERGATVLRLETGASFAAAIGLYERSGFARCGAFGDYPDHPASYFMEKRLVARAGATAPQ
jgi:putative acetyltransferase